MRAGSQSMITASSPWHCCLLLVVVLAVIVVAGSNFNWLEAFGRAAAVRLIISMDGFGNNSGTLLLDDVLDLVMHDRRIVFWRWSVVLLGRWTLLDRSALLEKNFRRENSIKI